MNDELKPSACGPDGLGLGLRIVPCLTRHDSADIANRSWKKEFPKASRGLHQEID